MKKFTLRKATENDLHFLYEVSTRAMKPVLDANGKQVETLEEYKAKFEPEKIEIIQFEGKDVGRLRVVRNTESIYIGGFQIHPDSQGKGIGSEILKSLIEESNSTEIPIILEVSPSNIRAKAFYKRFGFETTEVTEKDIVMKYFPIKI